MSLTINNQALSIFTLFPSCATNTCNLMINFLFYHSFDLGMIFLFHTNETLLWDIEHVEIRPIVIIRPYYFISIYIFEAFLIDLSIEIRIDS